MKIEIIFLSTLFLVAMLTSFTYLRTKQQTTVIPEKQSATVSKPMLEPGANFKPETEKNIIREKTLASNFSGGLGSSTQAACESAYTFFYSGSSWKTSTIYWDPSLTTKVTWGTVIVNHGTNEIQTFNPATSIPGSPLGSCQ